MTSELWLGIDQGTSGTLAVAFNDDLEEVARHDVPINTFSCGSRLEQDPEEIAESISTAVGHVLNSVGRSKIAGTGLANQGESALAWDDRTGKALSPVVLWSDPRGAEQVFNAERQLGEGEVQGRTGLRPDPYFSAAKFAWLIKNEKRVRDARDVGELRLGTLDTWLLFRFGVGINTDDSTASRTQLYNLERGDWDAGLLRAFGVPSPALPPIRTSLGRWGTLHCDGWNQKLEMRASLVDQPAALAGHGLFDKDSVKISYGTGAFIVFNVGSSLPERRPSSLLTSVAWSTDDDRVFAIDGGVWSAATSLDWLRSNRCMPSDESLDKVLGEARVDGTEIFIPALCGLGAPWWRRDVAAAFLGLSLTTSGADLVRAVVDGIGFQTLGIIKAAQNAGMVIPEVIRVDGGLTQSPAFVQRQADILGVRLQESTSADATARGAAALAAIAAGALDPRKVEELSAAQRTVEPSISNDERCTRYTRWMSALRRYLRS